LSTIIIRLIPFLKRIRKYERGQARRFIKAFLAFAKIGSPYARQMKESIAETREKLPEEQFQEILKKFKLEPGKFIGDQEGRT
jgi:hypothetical protein